MFSLIVKFNVEVTGAARLYRAASVWTAGLGVATSLAGYTVADAMVKYDLARLGLPGSSVAVNVNNLFDREYVSSCYKDYACYWGAERQVVATATFRF